MKKARRPMLIKDQCRRGCGTELYSLARSLYGADDIRQKYAFICEKCMTEEEREEILNAMAAGILAHCS